MFIVVQPAREWLVPVSHDGIRFSLRNEAVVIQLRVEDDMVTGVGHTVLRVIVRHGIVDVEGELAMLNAQLHRHASAQVSGRPLICETGHVLIAARFGFVSKPGRRVGEYNNSCICS